MFRLNEILSAAAAATPHRSAVVFGDTRRTYREVDERAHRLAAGLAARGVGPGDRVALWVPNSAEFIELIFGIPALGAIAVPLDAWWQPADALIAIEQARPRILIVGEVQAALSAAMKTQLELAGVEHIISLGPAIDDAVPNYEAFLTAATPLANPPLVLESDPAMILFTSGSTGRSKGAVHTHRDLVAGAIVINLELGIRQGEHSLHYLPLHSSCLEHMIPLTLARATHVIMPRFDAAGAWDVIASEHITHLVAVPTTLRRMLDCLPDVPPPSLRLVSYASEPMPPQLIATLMDRLPDTQFVQIYGMIEHLCLTVQGATDQISKVGTVGRPMMGAQLRIIAADGAVSDGGEPGEIIARSPTLFAGYWNDPDATALVMHEGWMRTGDIGYFDEDGFLILSGRIKEVIKTGGVTVIPSEVERALLNHEAVREAAVVGIPDEKWGEAVHAFVVLRGEAPLDETELIAFCRSRLTGYKTPKSIHFVAELPRTGIGKVSRREVREQFLRREAQETSA